MANTNLICKDEIFSKYNFKNKITYRIDLMYSTRIFVVAVVDFVVKPDYSADRCLDFDYFGIVDYQVQQDCLDYSDLLKDLNLTEGISSRDETLYLRLRPLAGAGTWWSACCTAQLTWPAGYRVDRDGPVTKQKRSGNQYYSLQLIYSVRKPNFLVKTLRLDGAVLLS